MGLVTAGHVRVLLTFSTFAGAMVIALVVAYLLGRRASSTLGYFLRGALLLLMVSTAIPATYLAVCLLQTGTEPLSPPPAGIELESWSQSAPNRVAKVYLARIDLTRARLELSPANGALTTGAALRLYGADLAVNASFFSPFHDRHLFDFYPATGDEAIPLGVALGAAGCGGQPRPTWPFLARTAAGNWHMSSGFGNCSEHVAAGHTLAVAGRSWLLHAGEIVAPREGDAYARTAIGLSADRQQLLILVTDGKQPFYSQGLTLVEIAAALRLRGAVDAIELDGGGSATMALRTENNEIEVINRPIHTKIPRRQRPVANHLLIYTQPVPAAQ